MAPLLPPAMAPRVPAPLLSVSESGRRRRPSARSRRLLLSTSAGAILARQEPGAPRGRRQATPAPATRGERPGGASGGASPGDTPSPPPPPPRRRRARYPGEPPRPLRKGTPGRGYWRRQWGRRLGRPRLHPPRRPAAAAAGPLLKETGPFPALPAGCAPRYRRPWSRRSPPPSP